MGIQAVHRAGKDLCRRGFPGAAGSAEQVGMRDTAVYNLVFQRCCDMHLADDVLKDQRPPFAVYRLICHAFSSFRRGMKKPLSGVGLHIGSSRGNHNTSGDPLIAAWFPI